MAAPPRSYRPTSTHKNDRQNQPYLRKFELLGIPAPSKSCQFCASVRACVLASRVRAAMPCRLRFFAALKIDDAFGESVMQTLCKMPFSKVWRILTVIKMLNVEGTVGGIRTQRIRAVVVIKLGVLRKTWAPMTMPRLTQSPRAPPICISGLRPGVCNIFNLVKAVVA